MERARVSEAGKEVLRNGSKAGGVATQMDLRTRRNLKQQSQRPSLQTEQRRARKKIGKKNGGRVTEEQKGEGKFAADSNEDEEEILVTPFVSEAS